MPLLLMDREMCMWVVFFDAVGGVNTGVNNVVCYNMQTNSWSALGTATQNGVSGFGYADVRALAIDG